MISINRYKPRTGNYTKEGFRLAILNCVILAVGGGIGLGLLWIVNWVRRLGFPVPLPVWLITFGLGIPCFITWFQYGRAFGTLSNERTMVRGAIVALFGDIPYLVVLYFLINMSADFLVSMEIHRIALILLSMAGIMMPIMTILGALDAKKAGTNK